MSVKYLANSVKICQLLLSLVDFGLLNFEGLVKFVLVEFGLGKFNLFDCSLIKLDVTNQKQENKKIHDDILSCCATKNCSMKDFREI